MKNSKRLTLLFVGIVLFQLQILAQAGASVWYFGQNAGLDFSTTPPTVIPGLTNVQGSAGLMEMAATITDANGNLLFAVAGNQIFSADLQARGNTTATITNNETSQGAMIIPVPGTTNEYYVTTVPYGSGPCAAGAAGWKKVTVNGTSGNNITIGPANMMGQNNISHGQMIIPKVDGAGVMTGEYWWIMHGRNSNEFHIYEMTNAGINFVRTENKGPSFTQNCGNPGADVINFFKSNGCFNQFVVGNGDNVYIFDFDAQNGGITYQNSAGPINQAYGIEFSPNGKNVYVSTGTTGGQSARPIYKIPVSPGGLTGSQLGAATQIGSMNVTRGGGMQIGPDGNIYIGGMKDWSGTPKTSYLGVISDPDNAGTFNAQGVTIPNSLVGMGVPSIPASLVANVAKIQFQAGCKGDPINFDYVFSGTEQTPPERLWQFFPGASATGAPTATATTKQATHTWNATGTYAVTLQVKDVCGRVKYDTVQVTIDELVVTTEPVDSVCAGANANFQSTDASAANYKWFDAQVGGTQLGTGATLQQALVADSICVWVEPDGVVAGPFTAGATGGQAWGNSNSTSADFNAQKTIKIDGFSLVGAGGWGCSDYNITVTVKQGPTTVAGPVNATADCDGTANLTGLGLVVPQGSGYTLEITGGSFRPTTGGAANVDGLISVDNSDPFFNWQVMEMNPCFERKRVCSYEKQCCTAPTDDPNIDFPNSDTAVCAPLTGNLVVPNLTNGIDYRWEVSTDLGATWSTVGSDGVVAGGQVTLDPISVNGLYRLKIANTGNLDKTDPSCFKYSDTAAVVIKEVPSNLAIAINPNKTTFCENEAHTLTGSATLTGPGTVTYSWSGAVTANTAQINGLTTVANPHAYRLYATSNGCVDSLDQNIVVEAQETAALSADSDTVCSAGGNIDLTAYENGSDAGTWSGPNVTGTNFDPLAAGAGKHKMVYTTNGTCSAKDSVYIIVRDKEIATISTADLSFCKKDTTFQIQLAGNASSTGTWSGTGVNATGFFDSNGMSDGTYTIKYVTSGLGAACSDSDSVIITINPLDTAKIINLPSVCNSDPTVQLLLDQALTTTGTWTDSLGGNAYITTGGMFDPQHGGGLPNGQIKVYFTTNGACPYTDSAYVTVTNNITYNMLTPDTTICLNAPQFTIRVDAGGGTFWSKSGTGVVDANLGTFKPTQAGIDSVWYGKQGACGDTVVVQITVDAMEDSTIALPDTTVCADEGAITLRLGATATTGGTWAGTGVTGNQFDPNGLDGTYKVSYTTPGTCSTSDTVEITVIPRSNATVTMDTVSFCGVASPALAKSASSGGTWTWRGVDGNGVFSVVAADSIIRFDPTQIATPPSTAYLVYEITGTCGHADSVEVTVSPMEDPTIATPDTTVCADGGTFALRLDAAAVAGGTWSGTGVTGSNFDPNGLNGVYKVKYRTPGACFQEDSINVTVKPRLDATLSMDTTTFCGNAVAALAKAAQSGGEWTWRGTGTPLTNINDSTVSFDPNGVPVNNLPETAYLVYKIDSLCGDADSVQISISAVDVAIITKTNTSFCVTDAATSLATLLDPTSTAGGTWSGTGITDANTGVFDPAGPGVTVGNTYKVKYTTPGACPVEDSIDVSVVAQMVATFTSDTLKVCEDAALNTLTDLTGGTTPGGGFTSNPPGFVDANTGVFNVASATPGSDYWIYYKVAGGTATCADSDSVVVSVIPREVADINNQDSVAVCQNAGTQTFTSANPGGSWSLVGGGAGIDANSGVFDPTQAGVGVHQVVYTLNGASGLCPDFDTVKINVLDTPTLSLPAQADLCGNGTPIVLQKTLKAGFTGTWSGSTGITDAATGAFDPKLTSGQVTATFTVNGTCTTTQDVVFNIIPIMNPNITNPTDSVCIGDGTYTFTGADANGVWSVSAPGSIDPATGALNLTTSGGGNFTVTYTITTTGANGESCPVDSSTQIKITTAGDPTVTAAGPFCENLSGQQLTNTGTGGGTWSSTTPGAVDAAGIFYPQTAGQGPHQITYSLGGLCPIDSTITINVEPVPTTLVVPDTTQGCAFASGTQFIFSDSSSADAVNTTWTLSDGTSYTKVDNINHIFNGVGSYDVTITNTYTNGCVDTKTFTDIVTVNPIPTADFTYSPDKISVLDPNVQFISTSTDAVTYSWNFDRNADPATSSQSSQFVTYNTDKGDTLNICLTVENNGCKDTICKELIIHENFTIFAPNAFTPNGDGMNDTFFPKGKDHDNILGADKYQFWIFNRWGEEIFTSQTPYEPWNGTHQKTNNPVQVDVYVWKMEVWDNYESQLKTFYGKVTVIR